MNIDFIQLWHDLERLPFLISLSIYLLVIASVVSFVALPFWLVLKSEPQLILRSVRQDFAAHSEETGWRKALYAAAAWLSAINTVIGRLAAWLVLSMTLMQFVVVIMRYFFYYGLIPMQESIWYMHGLLFMLGAGYTLAKDGHVRLDVFYRNAAKRTKAWINLAGSFVFLLPFCIVNFVFGWSLVLNSWAVKEGSMETNGLPYIYLFKTVILVFSVIVAIEGVSLAIKSLLDLTERRRAGHRGVAAG